MASAVILCAGKGTRMGDDSKNKVSFDCAGVPVVKRIVQNMRKGGVERFVIVVGHLAQTVMDALDGEAGIVYAYQKEQKGTGHAALCGLNTLEAVGVTGPCIISMGDKIIAPQVIADLIERAKSAKAVWGVQPKMANFNGGRIVMAGGKPYGVVEFADAAMMTLHGVPEEKRRETLLALGLNPQKAEKVLKSAQGKDPAGTVVLASREFTANEILDTQYANAGLYCLDIQETIRAIGTLNSSNAQGELYLTDTLAYYAEKGEAVLYEVKNADDMLTYSTKPELRRVSKHFMRYASEFIEDIKSEEMDKTFCDIYGAATQEQKQRYIALLERFIGTYGDKKVMITRAPGRLNLMGRHIDHRGGGINVMAVDRDTVFVSAPREDDVFSIVNVDPAYPERVFSVGETLCAAPHENWLDYLSAEPVVNALHESRGDWANYVKAAALRFALASEAPICGMDSAVSGNIPPAAGMSSSSSIVVAAAETIVSLNSMNLTNERFVDLCGEGEWFVGSRGGAGDHAAMKCSKKNTITHLQFKPFGIGDAVPFSEAYEIIVADSKIESKKSEGSRDIFNAKIAAYEFAFMILRRRFPDLGLQEFRDLAQIEPASEVYRMLLKMPEKATRQEIITLIPDDEKRIRKLFANHADPGEYALRGVALYGISECVRSQKCLEALAREDYSGLGKMMKISHDGDRLSELRITDELLETLAAENAPLEQQCGAYGCSTKQIDELCDLLNAAEGVLGSQIIGAGLGGCVTALVEKEKAGNVIELLNREYYDKYGYAHSAVTYTPSSGSAVMY